MQPIQTRSDFWFRQTGRWVDIKKSCLPAATPTVLQPLTPRLIEIALAFFIGASTEHVVITLVPQPYPAEIPTKLIVMIFGHGAGSTDKKKKGGAFFRRMAAHKGVLKRRLLWKIL